MLFLNMFVLSTSVQNRIILSESTFWILKPNVHYLLAPNKQLIASRNIIFPTAILQDQASRGREAWSCCIGEDGKHPSQRFWVKTYFGQCDLNIFFTRLQLFKQYHLSRQMSTEQTRDVDPILF